MVGPTTFGYQNLGFGAGVADQGVYQLIQSQTVSGEANINFTSISESAYQLHIVHHTLEPATDNALLSLRFYESGTLEDQGVYKEAVQEMPDAGNNEDTAIDVELRSTSRNHIRVGENVGNASLEYGTGYFYIFNAGNSSFHTTVSQQSVGLTTNNEVLMGFGGGVLPQASRVDGFRLFDSNNASNYTGTVSLYGVKLWN